MSAEGCLSGHYWHGSSQCSRCGARLRCGCEAYVREDNLDAHLLRCRVTIRYAAGSGRHDVEPHELRPGDYGLSPKNGQWYCMTPNGLLGNLSRHDVTEHEDGTITVSPSILVEGGSTAWMTTRPAGPSAWHGHLKRGEFSPVGGDQTEAEQAGAE